MAFNKLQGFTLLISFLVICLLNAKSYDFAEEAAVFENAVNEIMEELPSDAAVEQVTRKVMNFLPMNMTALKDPKVLGAIGAVALAAILGGVFVATRGISDWPQHVKDKLEARMKKQVDSKLSDADKTAVNNARETIKNKIEAILKDSDLKPHQDGAKDNLKLAYQAQKELKIKLPELIQLLNAVAKGKEAKYDGKVDYLKPLSDAIAKGDPKPSEDNKKLLSQLDGSLQDLIANYTESQKLHKDMGHLLKILALSDNDLKTVDFTVKPEEMKKGAKKP